MLNRKEKGYILVVILIGSNMLGLYQILSKYTHIYFADMICMLTAITAFIYEAFHHFRDFRRIPKRINTKSIAFFLLMWTVVEIIYTLLRYEGKQTFLTTIQASLFCVSPALISFFTINVGKKKNAAEYAVNIIISIGTVCSVIAITAYILLVTTGNNYFNLDVENYSFIRNGRPHFMVGTMVVVPAIIFLWNKILKTEHDLFTIICLLLNAFHVFYIGQTRTLIAYIIITFGVSFIVAEKRNKPVKVLIIVGSIFIFFLAEFSSVYYTVTSEWISNNSVVYRVEAVKFYINQIKANPLFGMGFIGNTNAQLNPLLYGGQNRFYRTDVGLVGFVNCVGLLGLIWFIVFLVYCFRIVTKNRIENHYNYTWLNSYSFLFFLLVSSLNLFFIDSYRVIYLPLILLFISRLEGKGRTVYS